MRNIIDIVKGTIFMVVFYMAKVYYLDTYQNIGVIILGNIVWFWATIMLLFMCCSDMKDTPELKKVELNHLAMSLESKEKDRCSTIEPKCVMVDKVVPLYGGHSYTIQEPKILSDSLPSEAVDTIDYKDWNNYHENRELTKPTFNLNGAEMFLDAAVTRMGEYSIPDNLEVVKTVDGKEFTVELLPDKPTDDNNTWIRTKKPNKENLIEDLTEIKRTNKVKKKHCIGCYVKLDRDAVYCHWCGIQLEKEVKEDTKQDHKGYKGVSRSVRS